MKPTYKKPRKNQRKSTGRKKENEVLGGIPRNYTK